MSGRNHFFAIFTREIYSYFNSPIAYIFIVVFVMLTGGLFMSQFFLAASVEMRYFFGILPIVICIFIPAISMRIWAEEKRGNTFELLLTFPMPSYQLVIGKFFAAFLFYAITLLATMSIPWMLFMVGNPDPGPIWGGYCGALFIGAFFLSIGIFISGLCRDQVVAFVVTMLVCFFFYLIGIDFFASVIDGWISGLGSFLKANFGMARHFESFQKGVIDNKDILYFVIMTTVFLVLNIFSIEDRMRPQAKILFLGTVGVCLAISMTFNILVGDIPLGRFDLTRGKIYTVTEATKKILSSLKTPVQIKFYISPPEKLPTAFKTLERDVTGQLEELKILSKGKLDFKVVHMEATPEAAQSAEKGDGKESAQEKLQQKGIVPFQVQSVEKDEMGIKLIYSAIGIAYKEKAESIIPRITPGNLPNFEYELLSKVYRLTLPKRPVVALVAPYSEKTVDPQLLAVLRQMGQMPDQYVDDTFRILPAALEYDDYEVHRIRLTETEPLSPAVDTLIVAGPENLNNRQLYEINRFLHEGGNVLLAMQGYDYQYNQTRDGVSIIPQKRDLTVNSLLEFFGVTINEGMLMDARNVILSISGGRAMGPFSYSVPVKAPIHLMLDQENMKKDISITGNLASLLYFWGSALKIDQEKLAKANLKKTVLFTSSSQSWVFPYHEGPLTKEDVKQNERIPRGEKQPLAVLLEGQFPNTFTDKPVPSWPQGNGEEKNPPQAESPPTLNPQPGKLLLMGCSKIFEEPFVQQGGAVDFFNNSVDALTLGGELINIRSHREIAHILKTLSDAEKVGYRMMVIFFTPMIIVILGSIRAMMRQKEKEEYVEMLSQVQGV